MKKTYYILIILIGLLYLGCEPSEIDKPGTMSPPTEDQLSFSVAPGSDAFHVIVTNNSTVSGIAHWDFGNNQKASGDVATVKYTSAGTYTITLTLVTNGGNASITQDYEQTETDFSIFTDPLYIMLSGGIDLTDGKTWVIDSTQWGHFGVGPAGGDWPEWWGAGVLQKAGGGAYDDEFNFKITDFIFTQTNHGDNYVSLAISDKSYYSNPVPVDGSDVRVNYNPTPGSWAISEEGGSNYLTLSGNTPLFFGFDNGIVDGKYRIDEISENLLKVSGIGFDNNRWYFQLIPKGYVKPQITFDLGVVATANPNEYNLSLNNLVVPGSLTVSKVNWSFGDPSQEDYETASSSEVVTVTYMAADTYTVKVVVTDSDGSTFEATQDIVVATNHPDYVPYVEANMMMYTNFDDYFRPIGVDGGGGSFKLVANPSVVYQNESAFCVEFTKVDDQWANIYMQLSDAYRFDLLLSKKFKLLVYGTAGNEVLLKLENKDLGGNSWTTGTPDQKYTIQESNKWEVAEFTLTGVDADKEQNYYNRILVMLQPGNGSGTFSVKLDDWAGPLVSGWKK